MPELHVRWPTGKALTVFSLLILGFLDEQSPDSRTRRPPGHDRVYHDQLARPDDRARQKIAGDDGDASRLVDLAGARGEFDTVGQVYQALERLVQMPGVEIVRFKDRLAGKAQASGYGDLLINLRMPGGHVAELRLQVEAMQRIDNYEHVLYEVTRDLEDRAKKEERSLTSHEHAVIDELNRRSNILNQTALDESTR